jgi:hypothetical protein
MRYGSYSLWWECMQNTISKELQLVMSSDSNILLILIQYLLAPEEASCQESGGIFPDKKTYLPYSSHQDDFWCWKLYQNLQNSIRIISLTPYFQGWTMKKGEFHAKRGRKLFQFTRII